MHLSKEITGTKLRVLCAAEGFDSIEDLLDDLLVAASFHSVSRGICIKPDCDGTTEVGLDQDRGASMRSVPLAKNTGWGRPDREPGRRARP
jgi:hypothetical protein